MSQSLAKTVLVLLTFALVCSAQVQPLNITNWVNQTVMMIAAHPDDIEATAGGTIAKLTAQGTRVIYVIMTNGDKGCTDGSVYNCSIMTAEQLAYIRHGEALEAAAVLGVTDVILMDYEDAMLTSYPEAQLREELAIYVRKYQPQVVMSWFMFPSFTLQPSLGWDDLGFHPDHQASGALAFSVARGPSSTCRLLFPAAGPAWNGINEFYFWKLDTPTHYVDISATMQLKINAYAKHQSQYNSSSPEGVQQVAEQLTFFAQGTAQNAGLGSLLVEGFQAFN